jgi:hypothetical protein
MDALADIDMDHLDELCLILFIELKRNLLQAVDNQAKSIFFCFNFNQLINFFNKKLSRRHLEVCIQIVRQSFSVISNNLDFELRHGCLHNFIDHPINHFIGVSL